MDLLKNSIKIYVTLSSPPPKKKKKTFFELSSKVVSVLVACEIFRFACLVFETFEGTAGF